MGTYDLTLTLSQELVVWEGDEPIEIQAVSRLEQGDSCTLSTIKMSVHSGTHVDAPKHFLQDGQSVDTLDPDTLVGPAQVVDMRGYSAITDSVLSKSNIRSDMERILFLTDNTERQILHASRFIRDFVAVDESGARWLKRAGIRLAGIDALSVAPFGNSEFTHRILLGAHIIVVEGLDMAGIQPGVYQLIVLPLKIKDCDGAPARAILIDIKDD
ncbi:cyclase family protein [bacterium]|nr:cyclase family protein [bacterium]